MKVKNIIIIGGGPAGMTAAIAAKRQNPKIHVHILEHKDILGKKILSTGNGRCNFTNARMDAQYFFSDTPERLPSVLKRFGAEETIVFLKELGIVPKERNGYYYPLCGQAASVLKVLNLELKRLGVTADTGIHVTGITKGAQGFHVQTDKASYRAERVILACGGRAASVLGSDGSGYALAKAFGHKIVPVVPALVQLKVKNHPLAKASGVRVDARVRFCEDGKNIAEDFGEVQITAYGISGIPVFQISRHAAKALYAKRNAEVHLDFLAGLSDMEVKELFSKRKERNPDAVMAEVLTGVFHKKLIPCILRAARIRESEKAASVDEEEWKRLSAVCRDFRLTVADTNGFDNAQVCAGGVSLTEVDMQSMESLCQKGLYLTGEMLDADGLCGGYNLTWAFASGYLAGEHAAKQE